MIKISEKIKIVLVGTTHPGNIGATARAMKTMSCFNLCLINPKNFPSAEATARAAGADDILANANIYTDLKSAIADCELVIGTSARTRSLPWPTLSPRNCAEKIKEENCSSIAIVFGRESSGLSNEELELCNLVLQIPTNADYSSLNLAAAVQIFCYEIFQADSNSEIKITTGTDNSLVTQDKMEEFYEHLQQCMIDVDFYDIKNPGKLMHRLRRLFNRALLEESEWSILRGFLSKVTESKKITGSKK